MNTRKHPFKFALQKLFRWGPSNSILLLAGALVLGQIYHPFRPLDYSAVEMGEAEEISNARELAPGMSVIGNLGGDNSHTYRINLTQGQYLRVLVDKRDFNLSLTLREPENQKRWEFVSERYGILQASLVAETSGTYYLEISSLEKDSEARRYALRVEDVRSATAQDREAAAAVSGFAEAEALRLKWDQQSLRAAIKNYTNALAVWDSLNHRREAFVALRSIGESYFTLSEYRQALDFYARALLVSSGLKDRRAEIETLNNIGYVYVYLGENHKALRYFEKVLAYLKNARPSDQDTEARRQEAQALNNMGEVYYSLSNLRKALDYFARALAMWTEAEDRRGQALARLNLGYTYNDMGDLQSASEHYHRALSLWQAVEDRRGESLSQTAIGGIHSFLGEKQLALDHHNRAMRLFHALGNYQGEAASLNGIAQVYEDLNQPQTALDHYKSALQLYEKIGNRDFTALTKYYVGRVSHTLGNVEQALDYYEQSARLSRQVGDRQIEAHALRGVGMVYESFGQQERAFNHYNEALKLYRRIEDRRWQARTLNSIGYVYYSAGNRQKSLSYYKEALSLSRAVEDRREETLTLYNIACVERDLGNLDEALSYIATSIELIESLRTRVINKELRTSYFASVHQHYELFIDLLMQMHRHHPNGGYAAAALQASEHARARSLLETLTEDHVDLRQGMSPELAERERALQQQLDFKLESQMRLLNGKHTETEASEIAREIRELTTTYQDVLSQIRKQNPRYATLTQPQLLRAEDIQAEVKDDHTLLLEYILGDQRSYLWAITPTSINSYELPDRATVEELARKVYDLLTARQSVDDEQIAQERERVSNAEAQYREQAARLSQMLLGPVAAQLGTKRLLIVCDGALQFLPFEALPKPGRWESAESQSTEGAVSRGENAAPLVLEHEIVMLPSVSVLAALRREKISKPPPSKIIAVLADPVFNRDDPRIKASGTSLAETTAEQVGDADLHRALRDIGETNDGLTIPRLPSTLREAKAIMNLIPTGEGLIATGFSANLTMATSGDLSNYRIVHFATHGIFDAKHPELSGIILSLVDENGNRQSGFLRMHDIYGLHLPADLVVLSACRTGLGRNVSGEGIIGITRGFMYAGSKSIIASLWKVDDEATAELMKHFYSAMLKDGLPPAAALRAAKEVMWKQERWRSPYFWAAFVLQGEYSQSSIPIAETHRPRSLIFIVALLILLSLGFYAVQHIRRIDR